MKEVHICVLFVVVGFKCIKVSCVAVFGVFCVFVVVFVFFCTSKYLKLEVLPKRNRKEHYCCSNLINIE